MKNLAVTTLNMTYFHKYNMTYDLLASYVQRELQVSYFHLHHFPEPAALLKAVQENKIDIVIINSSCLFDGSFSDVEIRKLLNALCANSCAITVFFAREMNAALLKKMVETGVDIMISSHDTPQELITALKAVIASPDSGRYISQSIKENLQEKNDELTMKEWEVINLINQGYSLSQIASKKCRAMSTVSTQKRTAMNKLHLKNESELLRFLHQNTFFNN